MCDAVGSTALFISTPAVIVTTRLRPPAHGIVVGAVHGADVDRLNEKLVREPFA